MEKQAKKLVSKKAGALKVQSFVKAGGLSVSNHSSEALLK